MNNFWNFGTTFGASKLGYWSHSFSFSNPFSTYSHSFGNFSLNRAYSVLPNTWNSSYTLERSYPIFSNYPRYSSFSYSGSQNSFRNYSLFNRSNYSMPLFTRSASDNSFLSRTRKPSLFTSKKATVTPAKAVTTTRSVSNATYKIGKFNLDFWKSKGYNHEIGKQLALDAVRTCPGKADTGCTGYTRRTLERVFHTSLSYGNRSQKAQDFGNSILSHGPMKGKFKKVSMQDVEKGGMPDGAIVLWKGGAPGYTKGAALRCGHGAIAYQNKAYSDFVAHNLTTCYEVWIPV